MKNFKLFKSGFGEKLKLLLIPIGLLIGSLTMPAWADNWYQQNNTSHIYFNDYSSQWVSDPSSNGIAFLMGRNQWYGGSSPGSQAYRMAHIEHTNLWYCYVPKWNGGSGDGSWYEYVAFRFVSGTTGWNDWSGTNVTDRAKESSNSKYSMTRNDNITGRSQYYCPSSSSSNTGYSDVNNGLRKYTAYLRVNFDEEGDGTYDGTITGDGTWAHGVSFDYTGTYMKDEGSSAQSTISDLNKNGWYDNSVWKWGYTDIPITGEVTFLLKSIDTGFEIGGWAYSESATTPDYTAVKNNPTFQVLGSESFYVAMIRRKSYTVTLNDNGGSGGSGSKTVKYDRSANMTTSVTKPTKSGYTFKGYFTNNNGTGTQLIDENGAWIKNVTDYTGTDGSSNPKWVRDDGVELFARWEQTIVLDKNGSDGSNTTALAVYNAAGPFAPAATQTYTDHTLVDYRTSGGTSILTTAGAFKSSSISSYVTSGKWTKDNATTLYAHWKVNAPGSITCTDNVVTISVPSGSTVHYTTNGTDPTASSPTYDPSNKPVIASSGITVKAIAVQSGCTNSTITSQAVTYTPVYSVTITATNASNDSGEDEVLKNKSYTATFSDVTGYDLPDDVTVTINGNPATITTDYTWSDGTLTILANKIDGNVTISVTGDPETYSTSNNLNKVDGDSHGTYTATYDAEIISIDNEPEKAGYHVDGYFKDYTVEDGCQNRIANADGSLKENTSYTNSDGQWKETSAPTLYTKWAPNNYEITLTPSFPGDGEGTSGTGKIATTMGSAVFTPGSDQRTPPEKNGYNFLGYYTDEEAPAEDIQILDGNVGKVTGNKYIDGDGNWVWPNNITAYGHWSPKNYTVTLNNEGADSGKEGTGSVTATFDATTNLTSAISKPQKSGYTFEGYYTGQGGSGTQLINADGDWIASVSGYTGDNGSGAATWKYYTNSTITLYAKWTQTINFNQNSATVNGTTSLAATYHTTLSTAGIENPKRIGYAFAGWATAADGTVVIGTDGTVNSVDGWTDGSKNWVHAGESTLYAKWTADVKTFTGATDKDWAKSSNWSGGVVPTDDWSIVTITRDADIDDGTSVHVGQVLISSGTLEIKGGGSLEVAGTITKANGDATETTDLRVSSKYGAQGALIFDNSAGTTKATVDMFTTATKQPGGYVFQMCAVPMTMVNVSESFAGKGIYTYAWVEGTGWERRNYYYAVFANEAVALTQTGDNSFYYFFRGTLASTSDLDLALTKTGTDPDKAGVNLFGNSWTAPIRIDQCDISDDAIQTIYIYENGDWATHPIASAGATDVIPAMQAYAVLLKEGKSSGTLSIDYDDAVRGVPVASRTAALRAPKRNIKTEMTDMYLRVSDGERATNLRLCEDEQFTNEFDNGWEAPYLEGDGRSGQLYAQSDDRMAVLATPDLEGTVVGFLPGQSTIYTISFEGDGEGYYLNDLDEQESTLIEEGNTYVFTPNESTNATRFVISKTPISKIITGNDAIFDGTKARKQMIDGILYIIRDGRIYDATGVLVK